MRDPDRDPIDPPPDLAGRGPSLDDLEFSDYGRDRRRPPGFALLTTVIVAAMAWLIVAVVFARGDPIEGGGFGFYAEAAPLGGGHQARPALIAAHTFSGVAGMSIAVTP